MTVAELKQKLNNGDSLYLIDVREPYEVDEFSIGGKNVPLNTIPEQLASIREESKEYSTIAMLCRSGNRSGMATTLLQRAGLENVENVDGGLLAWEEQFGLTQP